ncbi:MAG: winged helix-turn-helix domain-containing protein [Candidatus Bathyarchaeota archaeon]|nr:winged helix-turn-helix domain-containing protein [Candidatus Bathyarchaeota archaeon]
MPIKGKLPELEKMGNRSKIYMTLLENPLSFTELLEKTQLSKGTLAQHLRDMEQEEVIRRIRRNGKRVYKTVWDKEKVIAELKTFHFDMLIQLLSRFIPGAKEGIENYLKSLAKEIVQYQIDVFEYGDEKALTRWKKRHKQAFKEKEKKPLEQLKVLTNNEEDE